jgi:hypothetical protein
VGLPLQVISGNWYGGLRFSPTWWAFCILINHIQDQMFCEHCGTKIEQNAEYCQNCGNKVAIVSKAPTTPTKVEETSKMEDVFYSSDWERKNSFMSGGFFDVMADKKYLYIIKMPSYSASTWGGLIGLFLLFIIGAAIGSALGSSHDRRKRQWYRSAWIDAGNKLTSQEYVGDVFLKVPLEKLKGSLTLSRNRFALQYEGKKIVLKKYHDEFVKFYNLINKYVL